MSSSQTDQIKPTASEMQMGDMTHHDHGAQMDDTNNNDHPCPHCEQGLEMTLQSTISISIFAPTHAVEFLKPRDSKHDAGLAFTPPLEFTKRRRWLDPPPSKETTPITLKNRLLT